MGENMTITDYVDKVCGKDWIPFRNTEHHKLIESLKKTDILSLWGGTPAFENNRIAIDSKNTVKILLDINIDTQLKRLLDDSKGNESRPELGQSLEETYSKRIDIYRSFSNHIIPVDNKSITEIVDEILWISDIQDIIKKTAY